MLNIAKEFHEFAYGSLGKLQLELYSDLKASKPNHHTNRASAVLYRLPSDLKLGILFGEFDHIAVIGFGRQWMFKPRGKMLSNSYDVFLDFYNLPGKSEFRLSDDCTRCFREILEVLDLTLPTVLDNLCANDLEQIEKLPRLGPFYLYEKLSSKNVNIPVPVLEEDAFLR